MQKSKNEGIIMSDTEKMMEFLRKFVEKNSTSSEKAKAIRYRMKGLRQVLVLDSKNKRVSVGEVDNVIFLPRRLKEGE